jgi:hypothetical protein
MGHLFGLVLDRQLLLLLLLLLSLLFTNSKIKLVDWMCQLGHVRRFRVFPTRVLTLYSKNLAAFLPVL